MTTTRPHQSYRHEAFLYRDDADFLAGTVPFVHDGVTAGQVVLVLLRPDKIPPLRDALGADAGEVAFLDMAELGRNPARIIPRLRGFLDRHCQDDQPVRGVGEPVWAGRRPTEVAEAQLHEALLNVAVDPDTPLWLRCPYDLGSLSEAELAEAARSHPLLVEADGYAGSRSYGGVQHVEDLFAADLPEPPGPTDGLTLPATGSDIAKLVARHAVAAGLDADRTWALTTAVRETTAGARTGAALRVWADPSALVCEVRDPRPVDDPMTGRRALADDEPDPSGLWLANQLCDLVQVRSTPAGRTVRILSWR